MDNNPYDTPLEWTNFYNQPTEDVRRYEGAYSYSLTPSYQMEKMKPRPAVSSVKRLSKSEALELVSSLKSYIVAATLLGFVTLGGLVANQIFTMSININQPQVAPGMQVFPRHAHFREESPYPSGSSNSGGFFNQQGQGQGGGYGFGPGNNSSPFSGSHTS